MLSQDELYMQRCLQLAKLGAGNVAPNPMVGAVLVYGDRIIGEGYHRKYGDAHAEVNCIASVKEAEKDFLKQSTLYVSLEPCAHYGKTPPCSDLIIRSKIPRVIIGCSDPFTEVNGRGIEKLKNAGVDVITVLENECKELNKRFFTFHRKKRPYIILKWAQTANKKISSNDNKRLIISNPYTNKLVHKWRSEEAAILIGTNTALADDPLLTNRLWTGKNPVRLIIDTSLRLPLSLKIFNGDAATIIFNYHKSTGVGLNESLNNQVYYYKLDEYINVIQQITNACFKLNIQSVLVEGGVKLLQSFINENLFDEVRIITNNDLFVEQGLNAPEFKSESLKYSNQIFSDTIGFFL